MYSYLRSKLTKLLLSVFTLIFASPLVQAQPSTDINTYVLFAYETLHFKGRNGGDLTNGVIEGGNVGVNSCAIVNTKNLTFGGPVTMPTDGTYAVGYDVRVEPGCDLWQLYAKFVQAAYDPTVIRDVPSRPFQDYTCPLIPLGLLPVFPAVVPGATNMTVEKNASLVLPPGDYAEVWVKDGGSLTLGAGLYQLKWLHCGKGVTVNTVDGTEVRIAEDMSFNNDCLIGPSDLAKFFVRSDNVSSNDATVNYSHRTEFHGQVFAPNGRVALGHSTDLFGRFWANSFNSDWNVSIHYRAPECGIEGPPNVCNNTNNHIFSAPLGGTYLWSVTGNGSIPGSTTGQTVSVNALGTGSMTVHLSYTIGGVTFSCTKNVTVENCDIVCQCVTCDGIIVVDQNTTINLAQPTLATQYSGDPDLFPYFSSIKAGNVDQWKAIFNMGNKKFLLKSGVTLTVVNVPNTSNNQGAPGIQINGNCTFESEPGSRIIVNSINRNAGDIGLDFKGNIIVNGEIRDEVSGTNGLPGAITIKSTCGNISEGRTGLIQVLGVDPGANVITLMTCGQDCVPGDITIDGLVRDYAHAHAGDLTLNRPIIRVLAVNGSVTVNGNTVEPYWDEFSLNGGLYDIYPGLLSWVRDNVNPGRVEIQAKGDITVNGHGADPTGPVRKSFGAVAAVATASSAPGGLVDVRSLQGKITGNDRAFDVSGKNKLATLFAHINLAAKLDISLNRLGLNDTYNPVADASAPASGNRGGINDIRSYMGEITVGLNAVVSANAPGGTAGANNLTSCVGVTNDGTVIPADANILDDAGVCEVGPFQFIPSFCGGIARGTQDGPVTENVIPQTILFKAYPNPFNRITNISYTLADREKVELKIYNMSGKEVASLVNNEEVKGAHKVQWDAAGMPDGVYIVSLKAGEFKTIAKLVLVK